MPGVTRDRIEVETSWLDKDFKLVDFLFRYIGIDIVKNIIYISAMQCTYWKNLNITKLIKFIYTRDSIDVYFTYKNDKYIITDTAGIRKKSVMFKDTIEKYGYYRSLILHLLHV